MTTKEKAKNPETKKTKAWAEMEKLGQIGDKHIRIVQGVKSPMLDVRQHIETETYQGYTKRGIVLSFDEAKTLCEIISKRLLASPKKKQT